MYAYQLYPRLSLLTLTVEKANNWEDQIAFIGTERQWHSAKTLEMVMKTNLRN